MREVFRPIGRGKQILGIVGSALLSGAIATSGVGFSNEPDQGNSNFVIPTSSSKCDNSLWSHVYDPERLQIIEDCITVSGIIKKIEKEKDGDEHVLVKPDPAFFQIRFDPRFQGNIDFQDGNLVTEPVCAVPIEDENVRKQGVCDNFSQHFDLEVGEHVEMTGSFVFDKNPEENHEWLEIHPITSIVHR